MIRRALLGLAMMIAAALGLCACASAAGPVAAWEERSPVTSDSVDVVVEGARRLDPVPVAYRRWAEEVTRCLQELSAPVRIRAGIRAWAADSIAKDGMAGAGIWLWPADMIVLARHVATEQVVKHELAHIYCPSCPHPVVRRCAREGR